MSLLNFTFISLTANSKLFKINESRYPVLNLLVISIRFNTPSHTFCHKHLDFVPYNLNISYTF